jgi:hypothetical protein
MHYRAISKATWHNCHNVWLVDTDLDEPGFIDAKSEAEAEEKFRLMHSLCPTCLKTGTPVAVEFESHIHVDKLPRFGIK